MTDDNTGACRNFEQFGWLVLSYTPRNIPGIRLENEGHQILLIELRDGACKSSVGIRLVHGAHIIRDVLTESVSKLHSSFLHFLIRQQPHERFITSAQPV